MQRRQFISHSALAGASLIGTGQAHATLRQPSAAILWNRVMLQAVMNTVMPVTHAARALAMVHEAIYNAWAHYDLRAAFTQKNLSKRLILEWNDINRRVAISHAAHGVLVELFPTQTPLFEVLLQTQIADAWLSVGGWNAGNVGRQSAYRVIESRNNDGANQRGDLAPGAYSDWTGYAPVNTPDLITDISRWQPLRLTNAAGQLVVQRFLTPHWGRVRPFALASGSVYRPALSPAAPTQAEMLEVIEFSGNLDDRAKALCDFWAANPGSVTPPGMWLQMAETVSALDGNSLADDVKLLFTTAQAGLDASIAAWDAKRTYDQVRPATAIPYFFRGQTIRAWAGPGQGVRQILGEHWVPWQRPVNRTPPFPDFVSGHSCFSAACATAMAAVRGSDLARLAVTVKAGSFRTDPGLPLADIGFQWNSLSEAADAAGLSRRMCGIHWSRSDLGGRSLGRRVGQTVAAKAAALFRGSH